jgi:TetR/AcrR family transcriptional repressor of nem operon
MRVSRAQAERNRRRILRVAARLFRERGIDSTGVDAITDRAGLTHGAFYSQFDSKEDVVAEATRLALCSSDELVRRLGERGAHGFARFVDAYLATAHRDRPGDGCLTAALGAEIARQPRPVRQAFTDGLKRSLDALAGLVSGRRAADRYDDAIAAFALLVGAITLARAVNDEAFSRRILRAAAKRLTRGRTPRAS